MPTTAAMNDTYPAPLDDAALAQTWHEAWSALGRRAPAGVRVELMHAWAEPHRHHHDQRHLRECLALWKRWRDGCERPGEVALALWFHDAVYDAQAAQTGSNQLKSAAWAARSLAHAGADSNTAQRVHDLVMSTQQATQHGAPADLASDADAQLVVDIDLSILGSPAERFERYDQDVRKEYAWVRSFRYRERRARVLQGLLDRPRLYHFEPAVALFERQARINLTAALSRLAL